jgi:wobble nucleotide-excising tRNase
MLKKIIGVRSVGRFVSSALPGVPACLKTTLVLGGNGFGKTTLCSILRSLATDDPLIIIGRTRLGAVTPPEVELLFESGSVTFRKGAWNAPVREIVVFDGVFIAENVHTGDVVDLEQRRNFYRVIVGKEGVDFAIEEERLAGESRAKGSEIKAIEKAIQSHISAGIKFDDFIALPADVQIDAKIVAQAKAIEAVRAAGILKARSGLTPLSLPELPPGLEACLAQTLEGIAEDAQKRIAAHIAHQRLGEHGEEWLQQGTERIVDEDCPYCGQSLKGLSLIDAYRKVFAESYRLSKEEVERIRTDIERDFGERMVGSIDTLCATNNAAVEFWSQYCTLPKLAPPVEPRDGLRAIRAAALARLAAKAAAPQEAAPAGTDFEQAMALFTAARAAAYRYNAAIATTNSAIDAKKSAVAAGNLKDEEATLTRLNAQKKRHDTNVAPICADYQRLSKQKEALDKSKADVRTKLEEHTNKVIKPYEGRINQLLDNFNAGFRIAQTKPAYAGGIASSTYQIIINNAVVDLGDSRTPIDQPSFKNTLSAGDRSTLALVVFISHLERDPDRAKRIVVFDDPFTSQDSFRRRQTVHEIKKLGDGSEQLIVFSHDATFLRQIRDKCNTGECIVLQLADHRNLGMKIIACDLDEACRGRAASDLDDLQGYITMGTGRDRDIIRKMRVVLETHCRFTYSCSFEPADRLGSMVEKIKKQGDEHPAWAIVEELDQINEYSRDHHHGEDPKDGSADFIDPQELTGFVKRTLRIANNLQA